MKKIVVLFILCLSCNEVLFADSSFLPALEFHYLYPDNGILHDASKNGISEEDYLDFLFSDENSLGEKVALISALASYFEWIEYDDNEENDHDERYFERYTILFENAVMEKFNVDFLNTQVIPNEMILLTVLMKDYETFDPNVKEYDRLAELLPESLTVQSIKVIAYAYNIVYNDKNKLIDTYLNQYLNPYNLHFKDYNQDIDVNVHKDINEWYRYMID